MDLINLINDLNKFQEHFNEELSKFSPRQIAYYFAKGFSQVNILLNTPEVENQRMLIRNYLSTKSEQYQKEFREHLDDPFLGERKGDNPFVDKK